MKKIIFAFVLILILAVAGIPFVSGLILEHIVRQSVGDINRMYAKAGPDISLEIGRYDRGFSSSLMEWRIKVGSTIKA
ncbi:DUF945 family protein [Desulfobacula sp.]